MKIKQIITKALLVCILTLNAVSVVHADAVKFKGQELVYTEAQPMFINGTLFVPVKETFKGLGYEVMYDINTKIVTLVKGDKVYHIDPRDSLIISGDITTGNVMHLGNDIKNINGYTFIPAEQSLSYMGHIVYISTDNFKNRILNIME